MIKRDTKKKIPAGDVVKVLNDGINNADIKRVNGLMQLHGILAAKENQYAREYKRFSEKLGDLHPRVVALKEKQALNSDFSDTVARHVARASVEVPTPEEKSWILHGRVMDIEEKGLPGLIVSLVDAKNKPVEIASTGTTDKEGVFKLKMTPEKTASGKEKVSSANTREGIFISVSDKRQVLLKTDDQSFIPAAGTVDYREIIIEEDLSLCVPEKGKREKFEENTQPAAENEKLVAERKNKSVKTPTEIKRAPKPSKPK